MIRYPRGRERVTGYEYEPWHLRWVGVALAREVAAQRSHARPAAGAGIARTAGDPGLKPNPLPEGEIYLIWTPEIARAITSRWISEVPSKIV